MGKPDEERHVQRLASGFDVEGDHHRLEERRIGDDEAATAEAVEAAIAGTGATSIKDMGKVVSALKADYAGRMDFAKASGMVKLHLAR